MGWTGFTDESGRNERHLVFGGLFVPSGLVDEAERVLADYAASRGFANREISWKKCAKREVDRYCEFARLFWVLVDTVCAAHFRAMVIDTARYPLRSPDHGCPTEEDGFYKFYHFFIRCSLERLTPQGVEATIYVAEAPDQYEHRGAVLSTTVRGGLVARAGNAYDVIGVERESPRVHRLHQLADVLLGAVSFRYNRDDAEAPKAAICSAIEDRVGRTLTAGYAPEDEPLNVWRFTPRGGR